MSEPQPQPAHDESDDDSVVHLPLDGFPLPPKRGAKKSPSGSDLSLVGHALLVAMSEGALKRTALLAHPAVIDAGTRPAAVGYYLKDLRDRGLASVKGRAHGATWKLTAKGRSVAATKLSPAERKQRDRANKKRWYDQNRSVAARARKAGTEVAQLGPRGREAFASSPVLTPAAAFPVDIDIAVGPGAMQFTVSGFRITVRKLEGGE